MGEMSWRLRSTAFDRVITVNDISDLGCVDRHYTAIDMVDRQPVYTGILNN